MMKFMKEECVVICCWNVVECVKGDFVFCEGLGYEGKVVVIFKEKEVIFELLDCLFDFVEVEVCLLFFYFVEGI